MVQTHQQKQSGAPAGVFTLLLDGSTICVRIRQLLMFIDLLNCALSRKTFFFLVQLISGNGTGLRTPKMTQEQ